MEYTTLIQAEYASVRNLPKKYADQFSQTKQATSALWTVQGIVAIR